MAHHGQNSGGVWNAGNAKATYKTTPDKESPLKKTIARFFLHIVARKWTTGELSSSWIAQVEFSIWHFTDIYLASLHRNSRCLVRLFMVFIPKNGRDTRPVFAPWQNQTQKQWMDCVSRLNRCLIPLQNTQNRQNHPDRNLIWSRIKNIDPVERNRINSWS